MEVPPQKHGGNRGEAPAAGAGEGDDDLGLLQLLELRDRRLRAAAFLLALGSSVVIYGTALNPSASNPEHILVGFILFFIGAALALLTLGGAAAGRVAGRVEEALRGFF